MKALLEFEIIKDAAPRFPRLITAGPVTRHLDERGYFITTGIGPDLAEGAKNAVREMIDLLTREENLPPIDAYMLCSVCADLRISQIVDAPNWTVSCYFPRMVF
jgi:acetamidase/formamidase